MATIVARAANSATARRVVIVKTVRAVRANLLGGSLNLIASEGPGARVEVTSVTGRDLKIAIDGDTLRCGEVASNPDCAPLTETDKQQAVAEAEEMVMNATAQLHEATTTVALLEGKVQNASLEQ